MFHNLTRFLAVNCKWSDWQVGECSVSCGGGTRTKSRSKSVEEENGGVCVGGATAQEVCNDKGCPGKIVLHFYYSLCYISVLKDSFTIK